MKILGIDPGLRYTGWGIIEANKSKLTYIDCGFIAGSTTSTISQRLQFIYDCLKQVIEKHNPTEVAVEETFVNKDPKGALKLGYARGIALMVPAIYNLPVFEYAPNTVKKTVVGNGHASKEQVCKMVNFIFPTVKTIKDDAIDAIAIAMCSAYHKKF